MERTVHLLWPGDSRAAQDAQDALSDQTLRDLELDALCARLARDKEQAAALTRILAHMPRDPEVLAYRQAVFDEICHTPGLAERFTEIVQHLKNLEHMTAAASKAEDLDLWKLFSRFKELGRSYAQDIARRYGISYGQLRELVQKK